MELWEKMLAESKRNEAILEKRDIEAKKNNQLVGRYIQEGIADGVALYVVTKELKNKVIIKHVTGIGDDYMIPYWGTEAKIDKEYALRSINGRDSMAEIFGKRNNK